METSLSNPLRVPRGTTAAITSRVLLDGELAYDTTLERLRVGDGATLGGLVQASEAADDARLDALEAADVVLDGRLDTAEGEIDALQALTTNLTAPISSVMAPVVQQSTLIAAQVRFLGGSASLATAIGSDAVASIVDQTAEGGVGDYKIAIGRYASTKHPDFAVDLGFSQPTIVGGNLRLTTPGDGVDIYFTTADGTPDSPTVRTGAYAAAAIYNWPFDSSGGSVASQSDQAGIHTFGRPAQERFFQMETPTQTARGGAWSVGITRIGTRTPIDRMWSNGASANPGFFVFAGAAYEDSGIAYPYSASGLDTTDIFSPMSGINPIDFTAPGVVTVLARDKASAAALAILSNTDTNEGHYFSHEKSTGELWVRRVDNGTVTDLARWGKASAYADHGFSANTGAPALRAQGISSQVDRVEIRGGDGTNHPQIFPDGSTTNVNLRLKGKGTGSVQVDGFLLDISPSGGGQIKFPATQNPSADANTLDDYEEGTWTPALTFDTPGDLSVAYSTQVGTYTKIGRFVHITCGLALSTFTHSTASGDLRITGLPFAAGADCVSSLGRYQGITKANYTTFGANIASGGTNFNVIGSGSAQTMSSVTAANMPSGGSVRVFVSMTYIV